MPLPKPESEESEDDFFERCMADAVMVDEYSNEEQRYAVCVTQWEGDKKMLTKSNLIESCEVKVDAKKKGEFEGYASVFGGIDSYNDTIVKGAYSETLQKARKPSMFYNHDSSQIPVGDWIHMEEDDHGLFVRGKIDLNHKDGPSLLSALERKAVDAMSIGFNLLKGGWNETEDGIRELTGIDLKEVSLVNFPADDAARVTIVKADIETIKTLKEAEAILRDAGYSKSAANAFVSRIKTIARCDTGAKVDEITKVDVTKQLIAMINKL